LNIILYAANVYIASVAHNPTANSSEINKFKKERSIVSYEYEL